MDPLFKSILTSRRALWLILTAFAVALVILWSRPYRTPPVPAVRINTAGEAKDTEVQSLFTHLNPHGLIAFNDLSRHLNGLPPDEAINLIRTFLESGRDSATHLPFKVGPRGSLVGWPTLRTFALDELHRIDPNAASAYSRKIMEGSNSADEWALALRNLAAVRSTPEDVEFLETTFRKMVGNQDWLRQPSTGFLEAFDLPVYIATTNLVSPLITVLSSHENRAAAHAAFLALDRLVMVNTAETLTCFQSDPNLLRGREGARAGYFARADIRDSRQRAVLEHYLADEQISLDELRKFAALFPNVNQMLSFNLLTKTSTASGGELMARDAASADAIRQWLNDPRLERIRPDLEAIKARLARFTSGKAPQ